MHLKQTRLLYLIFVLIFFVSAPVVIFYSTGWRYDFERKKITKTGSLSLDSFPKGGDVFLNSKLQEQSFFRKLLFHKRIFQVQEISSRTPSLIKNLIPDEYLIEIKKENYYPWQKKLNIEKEKTTFIKNINLFLTKPSIKLLKESAIIDQKLSPDQKKIAYISKDGGNYILELVDLKNEKIIPLYKSSALEPYISWSYNSENILIKEKNNLIENCLIVPINDPILFVSIKNLFPEINFTNLKWDEKNGSLLFGISQGSLYQINFTQKTTKFLTTLDGTEYLVKNSFLYQTKNVKDQIYLEETDLILNKNYLIALLPYSDDYKFLDFNFSFIALLNTKNNYLILVDPQIKDEDKSIILKTRAKFFEYNLSLNQFVYSDNFEISSFDLKEKKKEIITRLSQEINKSLFYNLGSSIIFNSEKSLYAIETDKRDKRNYFELLKVDKLTDFFATNSLKFLYIIGDINGKSGLFKIQIQ